MPQHAPMTPTLGSGEDVLEVYIPMARSNFEGEGHARRHSDVSCVRTAEPIEMPFGLWTRMGRRKDVLHGEGAHWRHPANTTEPSACGGDATLCQLTLTTCH